MSLFLLKHSELNRRGGKEPVDKDTLFQLGSTTKMFTALALLRQVDSGKMALTDAVPSVLPEMLIADDQQENWQKMTVHDLLSHQAGLAEFDGSLHENNRLLSFTKDSYPMLYGPMNPPGLFFNYSNSHWSYLGALLEQDLGASFESLIKEQAFLPLTMPRTTVSRSELLNDGNYALGSGVIIEGDELVYGSANNLNHIPSSELGIPAGQFTWSTPSEVLKMAEFLLFGNQDILSESLRQEMISPQIGLDIGLPISYGYGLFISDGFNDSEGNWYATPRLDHGGNTPAYSSMFWLLPEENVAVSILSSGAQTDFTATMMAALRSVIQLPPAQQVPVDAVDTSLYENHVGRYTGIFGPVEVSLSEGDLYVSIPDYDKQGITYQSRLVPLAASYFRIVFNEGRDKNYDVTFIPEVEGGESSYIRHREFVLLREE